MSESNDHPANWLGFLNEEDLAFIKRFVLASGSLKQVAQIYGVTYPTIRLRLDRLISKIQLIEEQPAMSPFERLARAQYADGKIDLETLRVLLKAHREELEERDERESN
jgi:hypothetical protein